MDNDVLKSYALTVLDYFLPRRCIVCDRILERAESHLCGHCRSDIPHTYFWLIRNNPMADRFNSLIQKHLEDELSKDEEAVARERYAYAAALFFYRTESGYVQITRQIKYRGDTDAGIYFGKILGERLASSKLFEDVDAVIPVPLHWLRQWKRGYNQAEVIAEGVASRLGAPLRNDIIIRPHWTRSQTTLSIEEKSLNVSNAFSINKKWRSRAGADLQFRHILLIDDIFTTGSTLMACFTALRTVFPPDVRISVATLGFVGEV